MSEKPVSDRYLKHLFWVSFALFVTAASINFAAIETSPAPLFGPGVPPVALGYTRSLLLFVAPVAALAGWFVVHRKAYVASLKAFKVTALVIFVIWSLLDIFLANAFFVFPVPEATLGLNVPAFTFGQGWLCNVPIEEFVFYATGSAFILLLYIFMGEVWFASYARSDEERRKHGRTLPRIWRLSWGNVALGVVLIAAAWGAKLAYSEFPEEFPGYATFLITLIILPSIAFHHTIGDFINIRAFLVVSLSLTLVSVLWEVTLALPYGFWGYREQQMVGIFLRPWSNLPIEASALWIAAAWNNVILFEVARVIQASERSTWELLGFGKEPTARARA